MVNLHYELISSSLRVAVISFVISIGIIFVAIGVVFLFLVIWFLSAGKAVH